MCHIEPHLLRTGYAARKAEPTRTLSVTLTARQFESIRAAAERQGVPIAALVRALIEKESVNG